MSKQKPSCIPTKHTDDRKHIDLSAFMEKCCEHCDCEDETEEDESCCDALDDSEEETEKVVAENYIHDLIKTEQLLKNKIDMLKQENDKLIAERSGHMKELYESEKEKCGFLKTIRMLENRLNEKK